MVMAAGAADRQPQPHRAERAGAIHQVLRMELFGNTAGLGIDPVIALEASGDLLLHGRVGNQIPCQLLQRELRVGHVFIEGVHYPVAPRPHLFFGIHLVPVGVRITCRIQPVDSHAFAVARGGQQTIHLAFISFRRLVSQERIQFRSRRRKPCQIKRKPPQQPSLVRFLRRSQTLFFQTSEDKSIDGIPHPALVLHHRRDGTNRRRKAPVRLPFRTLLDPRPDSSDFLSREGLAVRVRRRHAPSRILRSNAR